MGAISHGRVVDQVARLQRHAAQHLGAGEAHRVVDHPLAKMQTSHHAAIHAANILDSSLIKEAEALRIVHACPPYHHAHLKTLKGPLRWPPLSAITETPVSTTWSGRRWACYKKKRSQVETIQNRNLQQSDGTVGV